MTNKYDDILEAVVDQVACFDRFGCFGRRIGQHSTIRSHVAYTWQIFDQLDRQHST